ncbi:DUF6597 domain-containing transcriptional factor [Pedobacter terrae]|uniref:DUF6597 domain-containing transcriptional factor n=1 Tax=Pedobacter terrae TaxID=405671 RepID=UPI002FF49806
MSKHQISYLSKRPPASLNHLIESIWMLTNAAEESIEGIILPDGKIDLFLFLNQQDHFEIFISGICDEPIRKPAFPKSRMFAVSFYPTAAEYLFKESFADLHNKRHVFEDHFIGFCKADMDDFSAFYDKTCTTVTHLMNRNIDQRRLRLFELINQYNGEIKVEALAKAIGWTARSINRYFRKWLGITLKNYIDIIKFSNALKQLKLGSLYPELDYADQSHFIKAVKKFSGSKPTVLAWNKNDRFIQLTVMDCC